MKPIAVLSLLCVSGCLTTTGEPIGALPANTDGGDPDRSLDADVPDGPVPDRDLPDGPPPDADAGCIVNCVPDVPVRLSEGSGEDGRVQLYMGISADGRYVAYGSTASGLVDNDLNGVADIFLSDSVTREVTRLSVAADGAEANGASAQASLSGDGRFVAFVSDATNLVAGDANGLRDVFVSDRTANTRVRVLGLSGAEPDGGSRFPQISENGRFVTFISDASNLVANDTNGVADVFVYDRDTGITTRASEGPGGVEADGESFGTTITGDGRYIGFSSEADNLVVGVSDALVHIFVYDRVDRTTVLASRTPSGTPANSSSALPYISGDGSRIAFRSFASDLVPDDTNDTWDSFAFTRRTGQVIRVNVSGDGEEADERSVHASLSRNGQRVAFGSAATNLVDGDTNETRDIFVRDLSEGWTRRILAPGGEANNRSEFPILSPEGNHVVFRSDATNFEANDTNGQPDLYLSPVPES